ncbi:MAG: NAD(P)-dependent alcohol dehydrogenase [Deltaproteobacteria bacterium]|nr:MAG: NAD(P)-dependent alcohol dehydrogenase [Deltaproteobacteria bacterium]
MRAALVPTYGSPDTLVLAERQTPEPGPRELRVRVHASPVTQGDRRIRAGDFPGIMATLGRLLVGWSGPRAAVPGSMFAGVVDAVGAEVTGFAPGDRVFGASMDGAHAEYLVIDHTKAVAHMPEGASFAEAAAVCFGTSTALPFLRDLGEVKPGQRVLVIGAAGGVGRYAVQVARHLGARVTGVCRREQVELVRALGADDVIAREDADWRVSDAQWDVIFDTSDHFVFAEARPRLTAHGRFLTLGLASWSGIWDLLRSAWSSGKKARWTVVMDEQSNVEAVAGLLETGAIRPVVGPRFPLAQLAEAHRVLEARNTEGDVIIDVIAPRPREVAATA